jgi:16S rRNA (uracil1498-N3)-methyltransferase
MSERFYVSTPITGPRAKLEGTEVHHLVHVMRAKVGDRVSVFDGSGAEFEAEVESIGKSAAELAVLSRSDISRESMSPLTLAVALPKGERQQWMIEKLVELGTAGIVPLSTKRGVAQPTDSALARLRRAVVEASKQCGRNRLLEIQPARDWIGFATSCDTGATRLIADIRGACAREIWPKRFATASSSKVIAAVGPEGGFTEEEIATAVQAGWKTVTLGPRTLRVDTAAIALAAWGALLE